MGAYLGNVEKPLSSASCQQSKCAREAKRTLTDMQWVEKRATTYQSAKQWDYGQVLPVCGAFPGSGFKPVIPKRVRHVLITCNTIMLNERDQDTSFMGL